MSLLLLKDSSCEGRNQQPQKDISQMRLSHARPIGSVTFDERNLVSAAGLVPLVRLAESAGLRDLAGARLSVPG
jgi:hypothetical protein